MIHIHPRRIVSRIQARIFSDTGDQRRLSVAIPIFERDRFSDACLDLLVGDPRVSEIVFRDDASSEAVFRELERQLLRRSKKIRLLRNPENFGPLANKWISVADCHEERVILLDSDNSIGRDYLDLLFRIPRWDPDLIYCPDFAKPQFDYRHLGGRTLDLAAIQTMLSADRSRSVAVFLNTGNYFVPRIRYVERVRSQLAFASTVPDVLLANHGWLRDGGRLHIVPGLEYSHLVHDGSYVHQHRANYRNLARSVRECIVTGVELPAALLRPRAELDSIGDTVVNRE